MIHTLITCIINAIMKIKTSKQKLYIKIKELQLENEKLKRILKIIFVAKTFKVWQFYCYVRDHFKKLFLNKKNFQNNLTYLYKKIKEKMNPFIVHVSIPKTLQKFDNISIVIPTYNAASYIPNLIKAIRMQQNIVDPEVIFVDSESTDETIKLANYYQIKVIKIKKKEFNHGLARNLGARNAKGKYIIFTVQDALPIDNFTYVNMLSVLTNNKNVIGVSTKQTPYPDADLFSQWQVYNHNSILGLNNTNFVSSLPAHNKFFKLSFFEKRKISLYDDVCSCVIKNEFFKLGMYQKINFAEDIEFSIRALLKRYKIGFTGKSGVIHSHNRPTEYFFRRYYADNKIVNKLFKEKHKPFFQSIHDILQHCYTTYFYIYSYINSSKFEFLMPDFTEFISNAENSRQNIKFSSESQMLDVLIKFSETVGIIIIKNQDYRKIDQTIYEQFRSIFNSASNLVDIKKHDSYSIKSFCDKLFTTIVGSHLTMLSEIDKDVRNKLDILLMKGI